jgi:hypothetical protein
MTSFGQSVASNDTEPPRGGEPVAATSDKCFTLLGAALLRVASEGAARWSRIRERRAPGLLGFEVFAILEARTCESAPTRPLCVPKIRFCNIGDEGRQGQVVM